LLILISAAGLWHLTEPPAKRALPWGTSVQEQGLDFFVDYMYRMRADVTPSDFDKFVTRMALVDSGSRESSAPLSDPVPAWWRQQAVPPLSNFYVGLNGEEKLEAVYENGYLYFVAWSE
jgi:hypothetical protein